MSTAAQNAERGSISQPSLWFGFFSAVAAFSLEGFTGWVISSRACFIGHGSLGPIPPSGVRWLLVGVTVVLFAVAFHGGLLSYRHWRHFSHARSLVHTEAEDPREFVSLCGVYVSAALSIGIAWTGLVFIFLDVCMREH